MKKLNRCFVPRQADLKCSGPGEDNGIGPEMKVVHWHLDSNTIMPRAFYIFVWESMYACEMLITKKVSPWSRASEHPTTVQAPFDKLCFVSRLSKISWELICAGLMVRYHVSEGNAENAENIVLEVVCAQTGGKNPKAYAEKFLFIQTIRLLFKFRQVYPTYWKVHLLTGQSFWGLRRTRAPLQPPLS